MSKKKIIIIVAAFIVIFVAYLIISTINNTATTQSNNDENSNTVVNSEEQATTDTTTSADNTATTTEKANSTTESVGITIVKSEITNVAKFYKYKSGNIDMEVFAVKAADGTIRTALNTCQVCYDSGRGYYKQDGDYMVCQNCGNRFNLNQIEKIKGGCNPVPVLEADKKDNGDTITISKEYLDKQSSYFENWK